MSLYKAASLGLSVTQNLQLHKTNQLIQGLADRQAMELRVKERLAALKNGVFRFSGEMDRALESKNLPAAFLGAKRFDSWCQVSEVSSGSFESFSDKEYFQRVYATASAVHAEAAAKLSDEDRADIERLSGVAEQTAHLEKIATWMRIESSMKGGWLVWNGLGGLHGTILVALALLVPVALVDEVVPGAGPWGTLFGIGASVGLMIRRGRMATELNRMAETVGGSISARSTKRQVRAIVQSVRKTASECGIEGNLATESDVRGAKRQLLAWAFASCDRLSIPRRSIQA